MENFNILSIKLKNLVDKFAQLRFTNEQLKAEISFLKEEAKQHKNRLAENAILIKKQEKAISRIDRLLKKIDSVGSTNE